MTPDGALKAEVRIVTLRTALWSDSVRYYTECVGLAPKFVDEASQYAMFDTGAVRFAIEGQARPAWPRGAASGALVANFEVEDLATALQRLTKGGARVLSEVLHGPGYDYVAVADLEGNEHIVFQRKARPC